MCQDLRHLEKAEIARRPNGGLDVDDDDDIKTSQQESMEKDD